MNRLWNCLTAAICFLPALAVAAGPEIRLVVDGSGKAIAIAVRGLPAAELERCTKEDVARGLLAVYVIDEPGSDLPAMLGTHSVAEGELRFTPRFAFRPSTGYRAVYKPTAATDKPLVKDFVIAETKSEPTRVTSVYPTAAVLPENQLKFYLHFSAPMGRGAAYEHLKLLKTDGSEVDAPFLEIGEELWDSTGKRLTLFIDPGRIKKGVKPREDLGPALEAGQEYRLVVASRWRDAAGKPLAAGFEKRFKAGPAVEAELKLADWKVDPPAAGSREPLAIKFPQPLDHALLERTFSLSGPSGQPVAGKISIADQERRWEFRPALAWVAGVHRVTINTVLEDLAGNRIGKAFEVDELRALDKVIDVETVELPVLVK